ncbi:hypothetical protein BSK20_01020 [SR1 bacterium human oral taxon HOT-345]|nr:hypothetical protein BSK20_01020 [SR1 bacterium human oral taxon HOT-345]
MTIIGLSIQDPLWKKVIGYANDCPWEAGTILAQKMIENDFSDLERVFVAIEDDKIVGFCTFTKEDGIPNCEYVPFVGFIFVDEGYRGQRLSERLINSVQEYAKALNFKNLYIVSDHRGLYEKYGFNKIDESIDIKGRRETIFCRAIKEKTDQTVFLTSKICEKQELDGKLALSKLSNENGFLDNLKKQIKTQNTFVMVASDPTAYEKNDQFLQLDRQALTLSDLHFQKYLVLDNRNKDKVKTVLDQASLVILAGGNTYEQNQFFSTIDLGKHLKSIDCPIVGISAGAMNCGEIVINSSEKSKNPDLPLILKGMGISQYTIVPHFEKKQKNPDEMKLIIQASQKMKIYAVQDGSYLLNDTIYGRCDLIYQGKITKICDIGESFLLKK